MSFLLGIETMNKADKVALTALLTAATPQVVAKSAAGKIYKTFSKSFLKKDVDFKDPFAEEIDKQVKILQNLDENGIKSLLKAKLFKLADKNNPKLSPEEAVKKILFKAARKLKIDTANYLDEYELEKLIFYQGVSSIFEDLKKQFEKLSFAQRQQMEKNLEQYLLKLSPSEQEELRRVLNLESLSAQAILQTFKNISGAVFLQLVVNGFGFGAYLFLASIIHSLSLLLGVTIPFAVYTSASTLLSMFLSGPFLIILIGGFAFTGYRKLESVLEENLALWVVILGNLSLAKG